MITILLVLLAGMYLGAGCLVGVIWVCMAVLGNDVPHIFMGITAPITWPILVSCAF